MLQVQSKAVSNRISEQNNIFLLSSSWLLATIIILKKKITMLNALITVGERGVSRPFRHIIITLGNIWMNAENSNTTLKSDIASQHVFPETADDGCHC